MIQDNRWSIEELMARYDLEPDLMDLFVEGTFDKDVLNAAFSRGSQKPAIYEIDSVNVPESVLSKYGLSLGNKQRIIALSKELDGITQNAKVFCLADKDLDHWFFDIKNTSRLRWTSFCSIECHFLTKETIIDIAVTAGKAKIGDFDGFFESLTSTIRRLYALRLSDRELGLNLKWVALRKYLKRVGDLIVFDAEKYTSSLLSSNARLQKRKDFDAATEAWYTRLVGDIRMSARGHDYTELLAWSILEFGGAKELANETAVERFYVILARSIESICSEVR